MEQWHRNWLVGQQQMVDLVQLREDLLLDCPQEVLVKHRVGGGGGRRRIGLPARGATTATDSADYSLNFLRFLFWVVPQAFECSEVLNGGQELGFILVASVPSEEGVGLLGTRGARTWGCSTTNACFGSFSYLVRRFSVIILHLIIKKSVVNFKAI